MMKSTYFLCSILLIVITVMSGCGTKLPIVPVSGKVTFEGQPLEGFQVSFQPIRGETSKPMLTSSGLTNKLGEYRLKTVEDHPRFGTSVGEYRVFIGWFDPDSMSLGDSDPPHKPPVKIPQTIQTEGVTFTVSQNGTSNADFHLTNTSTKE